MFHIVARLRRMALAMPRRSPLTRVMPALCIATSVPVPIAIPISDQVLTDVPHSGAAEAYGLGNAAEVAAYQGDAGALHRHVGTCAHRNSDLSLAEGGCVVDTVAGHHNVLAFRAEFLHMGDFSG